MAADKEIPWCTIFLCGVALLCHSMVLMGNMYMSSAIEDMGRSVGGWADVGTGVANSLENELDELLANVTEQLTGAINRTLQVQDMIDGLLSMMGGESMSAAFIAVNNVALLQMSGETVADPLSTVMQVVVKALQNLPTFQEALEAFQDMLKSIKPALMQVGVWIETFADKVQATVEIFGTTVDRVQKLFDSFMSKVSPDAGEGADLMQHDTFNLFDTDGSGAISLEDLDNCGDIYAIPAIKGEKGKELIEKYDANGDGEIQPEAEFPLLTEDPSIVGITATLLRAFAKRLSMVSGNVGAAKMRADVALAVAKYFQLVSARNITKVGWISQMLTNATLPIEFSADVMIQLALTKDDPDILTVLDVGELVVGKMMLLDAKYTSEAVELLSTPEHFTKEGFEEDDQPDVVQTISGWMQTGPGVVAEVEKNRLQLTRQKRRRWHLDHQAALAQLDTRDAMLLQVMEAMPMVAKRLARERMQAHMLDRRRARALKRLRRFDTDEKRLLLVKLLHGTAASDGGPMDLAMKALAKGVPAKPETLLFAKWLSWNASRDASSFQKQCFVYTGESSSALEAFNTQVQGMVKKISMFIELLKKYATPAAIEHMEDMAADFASHAMEDVFEVVKVAIMAVVKGPAASLRRGEISRLPKKRHLHRALSVHRKRHSEYARNASLLVLTSATGVSVGDGGRPKAKAAYPSSNRRNHSIEAPTDHHSIGRKGGTRHPVRVAHQAFRLPNDADRFPMDAVYGTHFTREGTVGAGEAVPSAVWEQVTTLLRNLEKVLPTCIDLLIFARKEVSAVSSQLNTIFKNLRQKGVSIFFEVAASYRTIWVSYYLFVMPLTFGILMYGFWASGWFGGPQPLNGPQADYEPPRGFFDRLRCCCAACCRCVSDNHDKTSCFWSFILLFQLIVLLLFIVSIVFVIMAGIEIFTSTSCGQIYMLNDNKVCTETLDQIATFMESFEVGSGEVPLSMACEHHSLKTCDLIHDKMLQAAVMTVSGSFIAVFFNFELIFNVALIYERARWRRVINEMEMDEEK